jgi:DNA topoisomerase II
MPPKEKSVENTYVKYTDREHVLARPDMYIGPVEPETGARWVLDGNGKMELREVTVIKGLYKLFDEVCVNARDHWVRMADAPGDSKDGDYPVRLIDVTIDRATGVITVRNDGNGIDVVTHPKHNVYVPELVFGHLRTSTNYDDTESKTTGGRNGYGVKLAFVWALWGSVETVDHTRQKHYIQRFEKNLATIQKPAIKRSTVKPYTEVSFLPDYARFGLDGLTDDMYAILVKRVYDMGAVTDASVRIKLNGEVLPVRTLAACADMYLGPKGEVPRAFETSGNERWHYAVSLTHTDEFEQMSFVNGINTSEGGTHVQAVLNQLVRKLTAYILAKKGVKVKSTSIKEQLWLMLDCVVENPSFDSQTKDVLKTPAGKFGSTPVVSDKFVEKVAKMGVMETALALTAVKDKDAAKKSDGKGRGAVRGIVKLTDANKAGGSRSGECTLILCEGDSAKGGVMSGLSREDRNCIGVYALRGKPLNVRDVSAKRIADNTECTEVKKAMGLVNGAEYANAADVASKLRYGKICIMADQDLDGQHIKGLVVNYIETQWPSLAAIPGFLSYMSTPIVKARKGAIEIQFYNDTEVQEWKQTNADTFQSWRLKYYKGLGTSTGKEWREYFADPHVTSFAMDAKCSAALNMAFAKSCSDDRKVWLAGHDTTLSLDARATTVTYAEWIDAELRPFSVYDCERSVAGVDGLKPGQRKILYAARKRNLRQEVKVAQLAGYVSEHAAYHHGEASLNKTIVGMAQEYVGSNNIALLNPGGQFGTRLQGGKDSASERYIYTNLAAVTDALFPTGDDAVLPRICDDGMMVEPEFYLPVIPYWFNGVGGIGTGFSTFISSYNPRDLSAYIRKRLEGTDVEGITIAPYFEGFMGTIEMLEGGKYVTRGIHRRTGVNTIHVTELPIGTWTDDFKARLEKIMSDKSTNCILEYSDMSTDQVVDYTIEFQAGHLSKMSNLDEYLDKLLGLSSTKSLNNMHLFDANKKIRKYAFITEILDEYVVLRLEHCAVRIAAEIDAYNQHIRLLDGRCRFIAEQLSGELDLRGKRSAEVQAMLTERKYYIGEDESSPFQYLLRMAFTSLLQENIEKMEAEKLAKQQALSSLEGTTPSAFWHKELDTLDLAYNAYLEQRRKRNAPEKSAKAKAKKGGKK